MNFDAAKPVGGPVSEPPNKGGSDEKLKWETPSLEELSISKTKAGAGFDILSEEVLYDGLPVPPS
jgi:hypothetical protein